MKSSVWVLTVAAVLACTGATWASRATPTPAPAALTKEGSDVTQDRGVYGFTVKTIDGEERDLSYYSGKVLLIVNVASECGFTPQYKGLEALYLKYKDRGFMILGFPSNDFFHQEPGTDAEIRDFCDRNFHVTFDLFSKIHVKEQPQAPLYRYLTTQAGYNGSISWNFNKFLVGRDGRVLERWGSRTKPESKDIVEALEKALTAPVGASPKS